MTSVNKALSYEDDAIGIGRKGTIDKPYILKAPFWTVDTLFYVIPTNKINLYFLFKIFQTINWKNKDESTGVPSLTKIAINNIHIKCPVLKEQQQIGEFFSKLDNLITLHHRMFSKLSIKIPNSWEQQQLGKIGTLKNGMNFPKENMGIGFPFVNLENIFGKSTIETKCLGKAKATRKQLQDYNLLNGDVLFVRSSVKLEGVGEAALVPMNLKYTTYSGFIIRFRDFNALDNNFKKITFRIPVVRTQIISQATNSANKNISQNVLKNLQILIPSYKEQQQIGDFFSKLDNLITLHQRKCKKGP